MNLWIHELMKQHGAKLKLQKGHGQNSLHFSKFNSGTFQFKIENQNMSKVFHFSCDGSMFALLHECHNILSLQAVSEIFQPCFFYVIASPKLLLKHNVVYTSTLSFTQKFTRIIVGFHPFKVWEEVEDNALHLGFVIRNYCVKKVRGLFWEPCC